MLFQHLLASALMIGSRVYASVLVDRSTVLADGTSMLYGTLASESGLKWQASGSAGL